MNPSVSLLLLSWFTAAAILLAPVLAMTLWLRSRSCRDERLLLTVPLCAVGAIGYAAFFLYFFQPAAGRFFSYACAALSWLAIAWFAFHRQHRRHFRSIARPLLVVLLGGVFYLSLLYTPVVAKDYGDASAVRFVHPLPPDPILPALLGEQIYVGDRPPPFVLDWLSSDRPPLQCGLYLVVLPWAHALHLPPRLVYQSAGTLAQLAWLPAVWLLARSLGRDRIAAFACVLLVGLGGFALHHTIYVWPKLLAASFTVLAALFLIDPRPHANRLDAALAGACAGFAWLAHGSAAFALLGLAGAWLAFRTPLRQHLPALLVTFLLLALPWLLYQRFIDPPGNRLLKWHLAGVIDIDPRTTWETLRDSYRALTWTEWHFARKANILVTSYGDFRQLFDLSPHRSLERRTEEFFYIFRSLGVVLFAWPLWLLSRFLPRLRRSPSPPFLLRGVVWSVFSYVLWIVVMFIPSSTTLHQGAYALPLFLLTACVVLAVDLPMVARVPLLGWHLAYCACTWLAYRGPAPVNVGMIFVTGVAVTLLGALYLDARRGAFTPGQTSA